MSCAATASALLGRIGPRRRWVLSAVLAAVLGVLCWWLLLGSGLRTGGAALGLLAAGGWGLGLVPIHSNRQPPTAPRRRTGDSALGTACAAPRGRE
ncbi:hypothetical protein [Kitasatospora sp. MAP5-34]|uniref:hypothetical protein n=1 Tax=Kitasatospora sp. MAP5-34 TaxID=3035102 RepID=UPI0024733D28|nr:hypothetical protein [Kitasatospora sp. MAP5-34]